MSEISSPKNSQPNKARGKPAALQLSEVSSASPSSSLEAALLSKLQIKGEFEDESPKEIIQLMLSNVSGISTTSSYAEKQAEAAENEALQTYRVIGRGGCGTVFEHTGLGNVLKLATEASSENLWNDCKVHVNVAEAFKSFSLTIQIPMCHYFALANDSDWWDSNIKKFPPKFQIPTHVLCTERILPLPKIVRDGLTKLYCAPAKVAQAKEDEANKDCLVRLYLGKRRASEAPSRFFTLRNMILHMDQMESLGLDVVYYAEQMADALAVIHWRTKYDGRDIEFVLGSAPTFVRRPLGKEDFSESQPARSTWKEATNQINFRKRKTDIWVLDFNQCRSISMDEAGIDIAVEAFFLNDPYYPRPMGAVTSDLDLWQAFQDRYLKRSREIVAGEDGEGMKSLPERFIERLLEKQRERLTSRAEMEAERRIDRLGEEGGGD